MSCLRETIHYLVRSNRRLDKQPVSYYPFKLKYFHRTT